MDVVHTDRSLRRQRVFRDRNDPFELFNDEELYRRFRFDRSTILLITDMVTISPGTARNHSISALHQVMITLRFLASNSHQMVISDTFGVSQPTISRIVDRVTDALLKNLHHVIKYPSQDSERRNEKSVFYNIAHFPGVIGCIDGTHVRILAPSEHEYIYVNRKGWHSINVQVICDSTCKFWNIVAKWPGSTHDSRILRESAFYERPNKDGIILGDSGYPCKTWLMTPFLSPNSVSKRTYNFSHCHTRVRIEMAIGQWKRRFSCLSTGLRVKPDKACKIIAATAILHNITKDAMLPEDIQDHSVPADMFDDVPSTDNIGDGLSTRDLLVETYFSN